MLRYLIILFLLLVASKVCVCQNGKTELKTHHIIIYYSDQLQRRDYLTVSDPILREQDSSRLVKDNRTIKYLTSEWNRRFNCSNLNNYFTIVAVNPDDVHDILGVSEIFSGLTDLHTTISNLIRHEGNFSPNAKVTLSGNSLLKFINDKRLNTVQGILFDSVKVFYLNFPFWNIPDDVFVTDKNVYESILLSSHPTNHFYLEAELIDLEGNGGIEVNLKYDPKASNLFKKSSFTFSNERMTTTDGNIILKNVDADKQVMSLDFSRNDIVPLYGFLTVSDDNSATQLWNQLRTSSILTWCFDKNFSSCENHEITSFEQGGIPIYSLLKPYLTINKDFQDSVFPKLECSFHLKAKIVTGEYDYLITTDSTHLIFSINKALRVPKAASSDIVLNNPTLLDYANKEELSQQEIYKQLKTKDKNTVKYIIFLLILLLVGAWWWYYGRNKKWGKQLISKFRIKKPQARISKPTVPKPKLPFKKI